MDNHYFLKDTFFPFSYIDHNRIVCRAIIINDENKIYLINVSRDDIFGNASYLETPGGGINLNESLQECLYREIKEECGFEVEIIKKLAIIEDDYNLIHRHNISHYYLCKIINCCKNNLEEYENRWFKSLDFYSLDEVLKITNNPLTNIEKVVYQRERIIYKLVEGEIK